ncbi:MAG: hypothetical protein ABH821_04840 [archaeon]
MRKTILAFMFFLLVFSATAMAEENTAVIYKNSACGHCVMYLQELNEFLIGKGFTVTEKNFINDQVARQEWLNVHLQKNIPIELQGHMLVVLNDNLLLEGHVPLSVVSQVFNQYPSLEFPEIVVFQDSMEEESKLENFKVMINGKTSVCGLEENFSECVGVNENNGSWQSFMPFIVLSSGLLAGIHPCTIGVLLFFLAFLFTIKRKRLETLKVGGVYIVGVFLAYFLIGLGLMQAITFGEPHFAAKLSGILLIGLGLFNLVRFLKPEVKGFGIPESQKGRIVGLVEKASLPTALVLGLIVGACSLGCTAGIYFSVLGLLLVNQVQGIFYLLLYNLMFVLPLIIILLLATNLKAVKKVEKLKIGKSKYLTLIAGLVMLFIGLMLLFGLF